MDLKQIMNTYFKIKTKYIPKKITIPKKSIYIQTAWNCRIYSMLNNLYLNTWEIVDENLVKKYIESFGINTDTWNDTKYSWAILCDFMKAKGVDIIEYEIDVMKQTALFAELLKAWYSFVYKRDCHDNVLKDIKDNKEINDIIITRWSRHAVNICFINKKLTEFWSWGDDNEYNNFTYWNTDIFIKSIRAGAIISKVRFLDYK